MPDIHSSFITQKSVQERLKAVSCCVIIPTFNNLKTIAPVIDDVKGYCHDIFIVLDGPTDGTAEIVNQIPGINIIQYSVNRGKGFALRKGFKAARENGFRHAITLDSDGQHYAKDIVTLLEQIEQKKDRLIVGARKMEGTTQNKKSGFANRFSNFWFKVETFQTLPDTQSGYRLYPIAKMKNMRFLSTKYEFEVEVLVKAVWRGIEVTSVPVDVYYPPQSERISHFRPGPDFTRISILNTYLVICAILYGHWTIIIRALTWSNIKNFIKKNFFDKNEPLEKKAASVGLGVFMGIFPVWGFQMLLCGVLAHFFKLNKAISVISSNISSPPFLPFIIYGSYKMGEQLMSDDKKVPLDWTLIKADPAKFMIDSSVQYLLGSSLFALLAAITAALLSYVIFLMFKKPKKKYRKT